MNGGIKYRIRNSERQNGTLYIKAATDFTGVTTLDENNQDLLFTFVPTTTAGQWLIKSESKNVYMGATGANETKVPYVSSESNAIAYRVSSYTDGRSALICTAPKGGNIALHLAGDNTRIVPWTTDASASRWYIEPTDIVSDINRVQTNSNMQPAAIYDLQGRRLTSIPQHGLYITSDRKKHIAR